MFAAALSLSACTGNADNNATENDSVPATEQEAAVDPTAIPVLTGEDGEKDAQAFLGYVQANMDACKDLKAFMELDKTLKMDSLLKVMEEFSKKTAGYEDGAKKVLGNGAIEKIMEEKMKALMPEAAAKAEEAAADEAAQ